MMGAKILAAAAALAAAILCTITGYIDNHMGADPWRNED